MISQRAKLSNGLSSKEWEDYKRTRQGALAALLLYLYKLHVVCATTILTNPYVHASFSCSITHPHVFSLRPPCFLHVPWCHTFNFHCTCAYHVYTMRNSCPLTSLLTLTPILSQIRYSLVVILELSGVSGVQYKNIMIDRWWKVSTEIIDVVKSEV